MPILFFFKHLINYIKVDFLLLVGFFRAKKLFCIFAFLLFCLLLIFQIISKNEDFIFYASLLFWLFFFNFFKHLKNNHFFLHLLTNRVSFFLSTEIFIFTTSLFIFTFVINLPIILLYKSNVILLFCSLVAISITDPLCANMMNKMKYFLMQIMCFIYLILVTMAKIQATGIVDIKILTTLLIKHIFLVSLIEFCCAVKALKRTKIV